MRLESIKSSIKTMKASQTLVTAIPAMAAGIIMIIAHSSISSSGVIILAGILLIAAGLLGILLAPRRRQGRTRRDRFTLILSYVGWGAAMTLGAVITVLRETFVTAVPVAFGLLLLLAASGLIYYMYRARRTSGPLSAWFYAAPALLAGAAVYLFTRNPADDAMSDSTIMLVTGIALILYGATAMAQGLLAANRRTPLPVTPPGTDTPDDTPQAPRPLDDKA